ncbi:hypothetical protein WQ54_13250 [Bacillus sp. SA1-12]|uniref:hypothetical protein n=1 Tax=Bacillus sp. SA1-12 TaxID=1455638 RepID=UPI000625CDD6|nr:hypothetical protein [Bacillus sp. SA1-12]KKI91682.1 hypothetical protein WQ54_13250 [Bacillus sp. SA1-12]
MGSWKNDKSAHAKAEADNKTNVDNRLGNELDNENDIELKDKNVNNAKVINSGNSKVDIFIEVDSKSKAKVNAKADSNQDQDQDQEQE